MSIDDTGNLVVDAGEVPGAEMAMPDPNAAAPVAGGTPDELNVIPLTAEELTEWWTQIDASRAQRKQAEEKWDILMKQYLPVVTEGAEDVRAGIHFRNVHTKKSKLFFREPDLILSAEGPLKDLAVDPITGLGFSAEDAATVKQQVLNKKLGRKGTNARRMVGECLFDVLAWSGLGCSKIGYRATIINVDQPVMGPDPNFVPMPPAPGSVLGLDSQVPPQVQMKDPITGQPMTKSVPVPIYEDWYWMRFSPKKLLLPADLHSCNFDAEASWMGMEFVLPEPVMRSTFGIPDDVELPKTADTDELVYQHDNANASGVKPKNLVRGVEIYYKAAVHNNSYNKHPQAICQLVFIEGVKDKSFVHRPSPDQTFDDLGKLTPNSMVGFPYHIFTNRDVADSPWVPADNAFTNSAVKHINTHRRQSVQLRDANIPKMMYDTGAFTPEEVKRFRDGKVGEWIEVMDGRLANGADKIMAAVVKSEASRDDFRTAQALKQDIEETLGIGGTNAGATEDTVRTATEISTSASALAERMQDEQDRILDIYLAGVEKFDALLQRYADDIDYIEWVGKDGTRRLSAWNKETIAGRWAYTAKPDSQLRMDVARDRAQTLALLKETAPFHGVLCNVKPILKKVATQFAFDPNEFILPDPPPQIGPPQPGAPGVPGQPPPGPGGPPVAGAPGAAPTGSLPNAPAPGAGTTQMIQTRERG